LVAERRELFEDYSRTELPEMFEGVPTRVPIALAITAPAGGDERTELTGVPVSPGTVTGIARVVTDPACSEIEPDEVLVCRTTDPGWASLMMLASALVIDIGGPMSHGAIVARELGIPCVIGTVHGSRVIRTGDRVSVDGGGGVVTVLETATATPTTATTTTATESD
jgi:pyruvate,water dikinase